MSEVADAITHMAEVQGMTDLSVWHSVTKQGRALWMASCKITSFSCFVGEGNTPMEAMLDAMRQAWEANAKPT